MSEIRKKYYSLPGIVIKQMMFEPQASSKLPGSRCSTPRSKGQREESTPRSITSTMTPASNYPPVAEENRRVKGAEGDCGPSECNWCAYTCISPMMPAIT